MLTNILVFHDGSSLTSGVFIYLGVENKDKKRIAVAKFDNFSISVMEHVMLPPLINVLNKSGRK